MIDKSKLSNELIEGIEEVYLSHGQRRKPVPAGIYRGFVTEIVEVRSFPNPPTTLLTLNFEVSEVLELKFGSLEEVHEGHLIRWQKIYKNWGKPSMADALLRSAGIQVLPRSNSELEEIILQIKETGQLLTFELDWEGFSKALWDRKLKELTGATDSTQARNQATKAQKTQASKFATRARSYRDFPDDPDGEGKSHSFTDSQTGEEVVASPKIRRFLPSGDV